jgi:hypothetical protein
MLPKGHYRSIFLTVVLLCFVLMPVAVNTSNKIERQEGPYKQTGDIAPKKSGGPCEYNVYRGSARIVSIQKKELSRDYGGSSYDSYEVKFSFSTDEVIKEAHGKIAGKEYLLLLTNSWYPGEKFLEKYGIEKDRIYDCYLKVITSGTCTPIVFDFPDIDRSDYFENRNQ